MFVECGILETDGEGFYRRVREYSLVKGYGDVQLFEGDIEAEVDIDGNMQKIQEIAQYLPQSEMEKINPKVKELR